MTSNDHKTLEMIIIHICKAAQTKFQLLKHLLEQVINENLKNKKNFEESSKTEEGGDEENIFLLGFTCGEYF